MTDDLRSRAAVSARLLLLGVLLCATGARADEQPLSGETIRAWLTGHTAISTGEGRGWRQFFDTDGSTPYLPDDGSPSMGRWTIRGDQYCSQWPPQDSWTCYDMTGAETAGGERRVTWIAGDDVSTARLVAGDRHRGD